MKTKEKNPIPETDQQVKTKSDRAHIDPLEKKHLIFLTRVVKQEKPPVKRMDKK